MIPLLLLLLYIHIYVCIILYVGTSIHTGILYGQALIKVKG